MYDEDAIDSSNSTTTTNDNELAEFRRWRDAKLMEQGIAQGRAQASAEAQAAERQLDALAIQKLAAKGLTLRDSFGRTATKRGVDALIQLQRSSFANRSGEYARLRRLAQFEGLVK